MTDELTPDDAEQLDDLADRLQRAAATARRVVPANNPETALLLVAFAGLAEQTAAAAREIARVAEGA